MGEGGGFPAATKAIAEWFPVRERSTAMGMVNAGTAVGAVLAPPLIALVLTTLGWRWVFFLSGAVGPCWSLWWLGSYHSPATHPKLGEAERALIAEIREPETGRARHQLDRPLPVSPGVGTGDRQIPERRGVVFLPVLAAEVPLRGAAFRYETSGLLRLDSLRGLGDRQPDRRVVFERADPPRPLAQPGAQKWRWAQAPRSCRRSSS